MDSAFNVIIVLIAMIVSAGISYGLALLGEPRAAWLWCDIFGICS